MDPGVEVGVYELRYDGVSCDCESEYDKTDGHGRPVWAQVESHDRLGEHQSGEEEAKVDELVEGLLMCHQVVERAEVQNRQTTDIEQERDNWIGEETA